MRTRTAYCVVGLCLGLTLSGCGSSEGYVSTRSALAAFNEAGFTNLRVISNKKAVERTQRQGLPAGFPELSDPLDQDTILTRERQWPFALLAARLPSSAMAEETYARNRDSIDQQIAELREYKALPPGFALDNLSVVRVCNVIVTSYDAGSDPPLATRFDRAIALLRDEC